MGRYSIGDAGAFANGDDLMTRQDSSSTLSPASERSGGAYILLISVVAAIGGLLFGFDTAVISGTIGFMRAEFNLSPGMEGWVASCTLIGCMIGAALAGISSDRFGRKKVLLFSAVAFSATALICAVARNATDLVIGRMIGGVGIGMASMLSPMYIAEVAPARIRGRLVSLQQLAICTGILGAYFSNAYILKLDLTDAQKWRWMFGFSIFPAAMFLVLLLLVPESPRWLFKRGFVDKARAILTRISNERDAESEIEEIRATTSMETTGLAGLLEPRLRPALVCGAILAVFQQITGINAVLYYAPEIFKAAGAESSRAFNDSVWVGVFFLVFTFVAIGVIDRIGRKPLLIAGTIAMGVSLLVIALAFKMEVKGLPLLAVILFYVSSFAASQGPVVWVIMSEIFPNRIRGTAMSVATVLLWGACYLVSQTFPVLVKSAGSVMTFCIYAVMCALSVLLTMYFVPETKGRSLEEIEAQWVRGGV
jgi:sugar porter (SP) family MFS transporter